MQQRIFWLLALIVSAGSGWGQSVQELSLMGEYGITNLLNDEDMTLLRKTDSLDTYRWSQIPADVYPSGFLIDRCYQASIIGSSQQQCDTIITYSQWLGAYMEMQAARLNKETPWSHFMDVFHIASDVLESDPATLLPADTAQDYFHIPLGFMHFRYHAFTPDAKEAGFTLNEDSVLIPPFAGSNLTEERVFFAAAPMMDSTDGVRVVYFRLDQDNFYTNNGLPSQIWADFGDGSGEYPLEWGQSYRVEYPETMANATIRLTAHCGNQVLCSSSQIVLQQKSQSDTVPFNAIMTVEGVKIAHIAPCHPISRTFTVEQFVYEVVHGKPRIKKDTNGNPVTQVVTVTETIPVKPIVIFTGYNPLGMNSLADYVEKLNTQGFIQELREHGHDIYVVKYRDVDGSIPDNGLISADVIKWVNDKKRKAGDEFETLVMGFSAGGLWSRYGLTHLEQAHQTDPAANPNPHTRLWVSMEGEHQGANIPLGAQHAFIHALWLGAPSWVSAMLVPIVGPITIPAKLVGFFAATVGSNVGAFLNYAELLGSPIAHQTFVYHRKMTGNNNNPGQGPHPDRGNYLSSQASKRHAFTYSGQTSGSNYPVYPTFMRRVAISEGNSGYNQYAVGAPAWQNTDNVQGYGFQQRDLLHSSKGMVHWEMYNALTGASGTDLVFSSSFLGFKSRARVIPNQVTPVDHVPGSTNNFHQTLSLAVEWLMCANMQHRTPGSDCFVPTMSALDIRHPDATDRFFNLRHYGLMRTEIDAQGIYQEDGFSGYLPLADGYDPAHPYEITPFDALFCNKTNEKHDIGGQTEEMRDFLLRELSPEAQWLQHRTVGEQQPGRYRADFEAQQIVAGEAVTYAAPRTPFVVAANADVRMYAPSITFKPGFSVKAGGTLNARASLLTDWGCESGRPAHAATETPAAETSPEAEITQPIQPLVYPNPAREAVVVQATGLRQATLLTITGSQLATATATEDTLTLPVAGLPAGLYLLRIVTATHTFTHKLQIQP